MTYGKLPFQHLKRQQQVMFAICDQSRAELKIAPIENEHLYDSINVRDKNDYLNIISYQNFKQILLFLLNI